MGADAKIYLFDYESYQRDVVPSFLRQIRDHSVDIAKHCSHLDRDLAVTTLPSSPQSLYACGWDTRACRSTECTVRHNCPFHRDEGSGQGTEADYLLPLFQISVAERCLGQGQFLGRSIDYFFYSKTLDELGVSAADPIRLLLHRLGRRGVLIGYAFAVGTDGIHGWLQPDEANELAERLFRLDLPDYECSFPAMASFQNDHNLLEGRVTGLEFRVRGYEDNPAGSFEKLSLSFIRTVCTLAALEGNGVLWGNNVMRRPLQPTHSRPNQS